MNDNPHKKMYDMLKTAREQRKWFTRLMDSQPNPDLIIQSHNLLRTLESNVSLNHKVQTSAGKLDRS